MRLERPLEAIVIVFLFCLLYTAAIAAQDRSKSSFPDSAAAKAKVNRLGFGTRVNVSLQNGTKTTGRITGLADDHFLVTDGKGKVSHVAYVDVARIKKQNEKLRTFEKPFAALAIVTAFVGTFVVVTMEYFR